MTACHTENTDEFVFYDLYRLAREANMAYEDFVYHLRRCSALQRLAVAEEDAALDLCVENHHLWSRAKMRQHRAKERELMEAAGKHFLFCVRFEERCEKLLDLADAMVARGVPDSARYAAPIASLRVALSRVRERAEGNA